MGKIKFFLILILGSLLPLFVLSYQQGGIHCFGPQDCNDPNCSRSLFCEDNQLGCVVSCEENSSYRCPSEASCKPRVDQPVERCGYRPIHPCCALYASKTRVTAGDAVTLYWSVNPLNNVQSCVAVGGWASEISLPSGSVVVTPTQDTTYTLTCTNNCLDGSASASCSTKVKVITLPGQIQVKATLDGQEISTKLSFKITGKKYLEGDHVPFTFSNVPEGNYTIVPTSLPSENSSFEGCSPDCSFVVAKNYKTEVTLNFTTSGGGGDGGSGHDKDENVDGGYKPF